MDDLFKWRDPSNSVERGPKKTLDKSPRNVVVLAKNFRPTTIQLQLLEKGLTFIPTLDLHKNSSEQLQLDIQNYHRKLKLAAYFKENKNRTKVPFMPTSQWLPPSEKIPLQVHKLIEKDIQAFFRNTQFKKIKTNMSKQEIIGMKDLISNNNIVIKEADKGSTTVILDREQYIREAQRQLNNEEYYKKIDNPIYPETIKKVQQILQILYIKKYINKEQKEYLQGDTNPRERRFYILPKIHKEPEKWIPPFEVPPGRPIVSDCNSETYRTAEYIDYYLNPLSNKHKSYVKDTYHFIDLIKQIKLPQTFFFFTMDIDNLYTNIDTTAGLLAIKNIFIKYPDLKRPDEELLKLLEINLKRNDFIFDSKYYLQIKGTAMGKKFSPAYANIFMAKWEEEALDKCSKKPLQYLRYLDDIWGIWQHSKKDFIEFVDILNKHDVSIKVKHTLNENKIDFLDMTIFKGSNNSKLDIKVHFKETDTHALLHKTSFHPQHTFRGLLKSQLLRFHRICTREQDFFEAVKILFKVLKQRGYSRTILRQSLRTFTKQKEKDTKEIVPLITTFSPGVSKIHNAIKNNFTELMGSCSIFQNFKIISAYRRNKNLRDLLVRAELKPIQGQKKHKKPQFFHNLKYIRNRFDGSIIHIPNKFTPETTNCIYLIFCSKCGKQYIGQTKHAISTKMEQHKDNIINKKKVDLLLVEHFTLHGWQSMKVTILQSNPGWTDYNRKETEKTWIYNLKTTSPVGLNEKELSINI